MAPPTRTTGLVAFLALGASAWSPPSGTRSQLSRRARAISSSNPNGDRTGIDPADPYRIQKSFLERCVSQEEDDFGMARREMRELGFTPEQVEYAISERARLRLEAQRHLELKMWRERGHPEVAIASGMISRVSDFVRFAVTTVQAAVKEELRERRLLKTLNSLKLKAKKSPFGVRAKAYLQDESNFRRLRAALSDSPPPPTPGSSEGKEPTELDREIEREETALREVSTRLKKLKLRRRVLENAEDYEAAAELELVELGMSDAEIDYVMRQRTRRRTPKPGTEAYKGLTEWWSRLTGVHVD